MFSHCHYGKHREAEHSAHMPQMIDLHLHTYIHAYKLYMYYYVIIFSYSYRMINFKVPLLEDDYDLMDDDLQRIWERLSLTDFPSYIRMLCL